MPVDLPISAFSNRKLNQDFTKASKMNESHLINTVRAFEFGTEVVGSKTISEHWANVCKRELMFRWTKQLETQGYGVKMVIREPESKTCSVSLLSSTDILKELKLN